jgi:CHAT domain-containing protein
MARVMPDWIVVALLGGAQILTLGHAVFGEPTNFVNPSVEGWLQDRERLVTEAAAFRTAGKLTESIRLLERIAATDRDRLGWLHYESENSLVLLAQLYLEQLDFSSARGAIWKLLDVAQKRSLANRQLLGQAAPPDQTTHFRRAALRDVDFIETLYAKELALGAPASGLTFDVLEPVRNREFLSAVVLRYWAREVELRMLDRIGQLSAAGNYDDAATLGGRLRILEQAIVTSHAESEADQVLMELGAIEIERRKPWAISRCSNGHFQEAFNLSWGAIEIAIPLADRLAEVQTERQQFNTMNLFRSHLDICCTAALESTSSPEQLYDSVLEWKGRIFSRRRRQNLTRVEFENGNDAMSQVFARLEEVLKRIARFRRRSNGPGEQSTARVEIEDLERQRERLERDVALVVARAKKSDIGEVGGQNRDERTNSDDATRMAIGPSKGAVTPIFSEMEINASPGQIVQVAKRIRNGRVTTRDVQAALPAGTLLVDFLIYERIDNSGRTDKRRLLAFVLRSDEAVKLKDLGEVGPLDDAISKWHNDIRRRAEAGASNKAIFERVWKPLEPYVRDAETILLSLDGSLNSMPFGAVQDPSSQSYLIEHYAFGILPAPQLLPEIVAQKPVQSCSLLAIGDVDCGKQWTPLDATKTEIEAISKVWPVRFDSQPKILRREQPTEQVVGSLAPTFTHLHFATHGGFDLSETMLRDVTGIQDVTDNGTLGLWHQELASYIVLARGAEQTTSDADDGILTGLEVSMLDLSKVDLVVLSACESGLGDVRQGEGVLGIQRAFSAAGSRSVVSSLWPVPSEATAELMIRFYTNLWQRKMSKAQALREAQVWMLKSYRPSQPSGGNSEAGPLSELNQPSISLSSARAADALVLPYYWAGFVASGNWQ